MEKQKQQLIRLFNDKCIEKGHFVLASGKTSNYYIDSKKITWTADGLKLITDCFLHLLRNHKFDSVGGMTLGADPLVVAFILSCPRKVGGFIIRKESKDHGKKDRIVGTPGQNAVLVEDVTTTGGTLIDAIEVCKENGMIIEAAVTIVDREQGAKEKFELMKIPFYSILRTKDLEC